MLYHKKCGSQLYLNVTGIFTVFSVIGISSNRFVAGPCDIELQDVTAVPPQLVCKNCGVVPESEIFGHCGYCGDAVPLRSLYIIKGSGGIYCKEDAERLADEHGKRIGKLSELLEVPVKVSGH